MTIPDLIVTRHRGLLEWVARELGGEYRPNQGETTACIAVPDGSGGYWLIDVRAQVTSDDIRGRHVLGVLPLSLARHAASVTEVEMPGLRPDQRGKELTPAEMDAAGARLGDALRVVLA